MSVFDKRVDKRHAFVAVGCAMFPYARIKELVGDRDNGLNFLDIMALPLEDEDKVVTIEKLDFFSEPFARILAIRYARLTYEQLFDQLTEVEQELATHALQLLERYVLGIESEEKIQQLNDMIRNYLKTQFQVEDHDTYKKRIGCLENFLSVTKMSAVNAMVESSSIQRDMLGTAYATIQLQEMEKLAYRLHV